MALVRREVRGRVALLTLDRPKALNALDEAMLLELEAQLVQAGAEAELAALVITGEGRAFAAGADIAAMQGHGARESAAYSALGHRVFARIEALPLPVIAAVNGFALGGGCELALACDWIHASNKAQFGQPEVKLGLIPGFGGSARLARRVGPAWARELILTGDPIDAETALRIGLANRVFEPDALIDAALQAGEAIAARGPQAVALAKRVLREGQDADARVAHELEQVAFASLAGSAERSEGIAAFLAKRAPEFGRR